MQGMDSGSSNYISEAVCIERKLSIALHDTTDEMSRMECLDEEQRAEIYAILEALKTDSAVHAGWVKTLESHLSKKAADA